MTGLPARWLGPRSAVAALAVASAGAALAGGDAAGMALRACAVVALLALAVLALRTRGRIPGAISGLVTVQYRHALGRETGIALVVVDGRRLLVGYGPAGVTVMTELASRGGDTP